SQATEQGTSFAFRGVVTQITATMRVNSGWSGQHGLLDYSCKPSPFRAGLLTLSLERSLMYDNCIAVLPGENVKH
ncbi:hypothetical protein MEN95_21970, partial [Dolichospermum sp. ST_sed7]|nr:hypothetical protein [Dolichospermum sp. ST_sed7]